MTEKHPRNSCTLWNTY